MTHLALVKDRYPNIRANVLYTYLDAKGRGRIQIAAELPLMYAQGRNPKAPEVHFPSETDDANKPQRTRSLFVCPLRDPRHARNVISGR